MVVSIIRVSDHALIAEVEYGAASGSVLAEQDRPALDEDPGLEGSAAPTGSIAGRTVSVVYPNDHGGASISLVGDDLTRRVLRQRGRARWSATPTSASRRASPARRACSS